MKLQYNLLVVCFLDKNRLLLGVSIFTRMSVYFE